VNAASFDLGEVRGQPGELMTLLGGACVPWIWWIGALVRGGQINALIDRLANNPSLYSLLRAEGSIAGPERVDLHVLVHRSDQIDPA